MFSYPGKLPLVRDSSKFSASVYCCVSTLLSLQHWVGLQQRAALGFGPLPRAQNDAQPGLASPVWPLLPCFSQPFPLTPPSRPHPLGQFWAPPDLPLTSHQPSPAILPIGHSVGAVPVNLYLEPLSLSLTTVPACVQLTPDALGAPCVMPHTR